MGCRGVMALALCLVGAVVRAAEPEPERRTIAVTGQAEATARPDRVEITFAVETTAGRAGEAAAENARRSTAVAAALKPLLGPGDTLSTSRYGLEPRYQQPRPEAREPQEPRIAGYVAHNEVHVTSARVAEAGALVDAAIAAGANRVGGLVFTVADRAALVRSAIEQAGADARARADSLARSIGVRLKQVVAATTSPGPGVMPKRFEAMELAAARAPTPIEPGEVSASATVQVTWEIE